MSSYKLYLSTNKPWESTYTTAEGQAIYKTETEGLPTALRLGTRTVKISKIIGSLEESNASSHQGEMTTNMQDKFAHLSKVEFHNIRKSIITFRGEEMAVSDFFKKKGYGSLDSHRAFIGVDGREYIWKLKTLSCEVGRRYSGLESFRETENIHQLVLGDDSSVIARFHAPQIVIIGENQPAFLEIFQQGTWEMVDLIVTTLIYVEMLRRDTTESLGIYTY